MKEYVKSKSIDILNKILLDKELSTYIDQSLEIPDIFIGTQEIKLVILGQDPTVKSKASRKNIKTVLNLDKKQGSLYKYLDSICCELGIKLEENVYCTNVYKNFFINPPTQIKEKDIFKDTLQYWLPLLKEELNGFKNIPVLTLGQPVLSTITESNGLVKDYWGYDKEWKNGKKKDFKYIEPEKNILNRIIFPFPHQPSIRKTFYGERLGSYIAFAKDSIK